MSTRRRRRLRWLARSAPHALLERRQGAATLAQLEDSRRPLLFSLLPRMLRRDGGTAVSLQGAFEYIDQGRDSAPAGTVSSQSWKRALAMSRRLAARRAVRGRDP